MTLPGHPGHEPGAHLPNRSGNICCAREDGAAANNASKITTHEMTTTKRFIPESLSGYPY
jgi:hypothetical protein